MTPVRYRSTMHRHLVRPGKRVRLRRIDPEDTAGRTHDDAREQLASDIERLRELQDVFYADHRFALLIVLQAMDTAGKDGTVKHVFRGMNPSGCEVAPFKVPTDEEASHDFLWRAHRFAPRRGHITIFNRSHYEDVLVPKVHRTLPDRVIRPRYDQINAFERILTANATVVLKFFLHISKAEQAKRLHARLEDPTKQWKFSVGDVHERKLWPRYMAAYEELLSRCSTAHAPWYVVPANNKWYRNLVVADAVRDTLEKLACRYPKPALSKTELARITIA